MLAFYLKQSSFKTHTHGTNYRPNNTLAMAPIHMQRTPENQVRVGRQQPSSETFECRRPPGHHFSRRRRSTSCGAPSVFATDSKRAVGPRHSQSSTSPTGTSVMRVASCLNRAASLRLSRSVVASFSALRTTTPSAIHWL